MKSNEVRLNNYVSYKGKNYQINSIAEVFPTLNTDEFGIGVVSWDKLQPINITKKLLLKCGFKYGFMSIINSKDLWLNWNENEKCIFFDNDCNIKVIHNKIEYLHQLQNFYFALTNTELEVKL